MARTNTEVKSTLPVFEAVRTSTLWMDGCATVTCPRKDCRGTFIVAIAKWYKSRRYGTANTLVTGRSCPYCFRAGRLPARRTIT